MTERNFLDFQKRIVFGVATANFLAVIQLIAAPQFQIDWKSASDSVRTGQVGMMMMIINIPLAFAWVIHSEFFRPARRVSTFSSAVASVFLCATGLAGLASTLKAFRPMFGHAALWATLAAPIAILISNLVRRRRSSN